MLNENDLQLIENKGITASQIDEQINRFEKGFPHLRIHSVATVGNGIMRLGEKDINHYIKLWRQAQQHGTTIEKFVPASGAASRMFKNMFAFTTSGRTTPETDFEKQYFDNINGEILKQKLRRKIKDKDVLQVHDQIIDSTKLLEGKIEDLHPGAKPPEEIACPVGYYTSPWYANLYLEELDWFVEQQLYKERRGKRIKYVRHYLRYVDDMLLIGTSKTDLEKAVREIKKRLRQTLGLEIKDCWEIKAIGKHIEIDGKRQMKPGTYWCDIGGYKFCKDGTILRPITLPEGISSASINQVNLTVKLGEKTTKTVDGVKINYINNTAGYTATQKDNETTTSVTVSGTAANIASVTANDINVYIDLKDAQPGTQTFKLQVDQPESGLVRYELPDDEYELTINGTAVETSGSEGEENNG